MQSLRGFLAGVAVGVPAAVVIVAVAILALLNPLWVAFEQGRADAAGWTGFSPTDLRTVTDSILSDLILGPPDFAVTLNGNPVLNDRERSHMRDVRGVFMALYVAAAICAIGLAAAFVATRRNGRAALWRRLSRSGTAIAVITVVGGLLGLAFFDAAFEVFHELFFPAGTFLFDPRTDRLVQLFPDQFWSETTIAVGVVIIVLALGLAWLGRRKAAA